MTLQPIPAVRTCHACSHRWFTAYVGAMACPACAADLAPPATWPHMCSDGHAAEAAGECAVCARSVAQESAPRAPVREWRDRT